MRSFNTLVCIILWLMFLTCLVTVSAHASSNKPSPIVVWSQWMTEHISAKYDISEETASAIMEDVTQTVIITGSNADGQYTWEFTRDH